MGSLNHAGGNLPRVAFFIVGGLAVFISLCHLTVPPWHTDENYYALIADDYRAGVFDPGEPFPPVSIYILALSRSLLGDTLLASRLPAALLSMGTGIVLFLAVRRMVGQWGGLFAAVLWFTLPHAGGGARLERYGLLEPAMMFFGSLGLYFGWRWINEDGRWWPILTGVAFALSAGAKAPGILPFVVVVFMVLLSSRRWWAATAAMGATAVTSLIVYAPFGSTTPEAIFTMLTRHASKAESSYPVFLGNTPYQGTPWWATPFLQWEAIGTFGVAALGATLGVVLWRRDRASVFSGLSFLAPFAFFTFTAGVVLPHYKLAWQAPMVVALAVGAALAPTLFLWAMVALLASAMTAGIVHVATLEPTGYAAVAEYLRDEGLDDERILLYGRASPARRYLDEMRLQSMPGDGRREARVAVVDPDYASRFERVEVRQWLREKEFKRVEVGGMEVLLPLTTQDSASDAVND